MQIIRSILTDSSISISEFKKDPLAIIEQGDGFPMAVLNRNQPAFYCVPAEAYEAMIDKLEDIELAALVEERAEQPEIEVILDDQ
jgi:antitoxin StbD